jgi:hypothetical protein
MLQRLSENMISASDTPRCAGGFSAFGGDPYADETLVYRGFSLPCASFAELTPLPFEPSSHSLKPSSPKFNAAPVGPCVIRGAPSPKALRSAILDYIRTQGEAEVQLSEKRDVLKAKVLIFIDSTQEVLGIAIRIRAGAEGATAEWRRYSGDALQFHRFFLQVKDSVEALGGAGAAQVKEAMDTLTYPPACLEDAVACAQMMPEENAAALARCLPQLDAGEVAKLPSYAGVVQEWLAADDVRVVGPACSLAKRICEVDSACAPALLAIAVQRAEIALDEAPMPAAQLELLRPKLLLRLAARLA